MTFLVTGSTGFVGHALMEVLVDRGYCVVPAVRRSAGLPNEVVMPDLTARIRWDGLLSGCSAVIHMAARAHIMKDEAADPLAEYRKVNVQGTLALARQAVQAGVQRFVFVSSIKVNGESTACALPFLADDAPAPEDAYGVSKHEAEQGLMELARETGMEVVVIRPPLVYGPGVKGNFAAMVQWVRKGVPLPLGAVQNQRSLVALDNLADFIALCADPARSPLAANEVFLLSDGEDVSTAELLRKLARAYGTKLRLVSVPPRWLRMSAGLLGRGAVAERLLTSLVVDSTKARDLLGWKPVVSMDEQLEKMANYDTRV